MSSLITGLNQNTAVALQTRQEVEARLLEAGRWLAFVNSVEPELNQHQVLRFETEIRECRALLYAMLTDAEQAECEGISEADCLARRAHGQGKRLIAVSDAEVVEAYSIKFQCEVMVSFGHAPEEYALDLQMANNILSVATPKQLWNAGWVFEESCVACE